MKKITILVVLLLLSLAAYASTDKKTQKTPTQKTTASKYTDQKYKFTVPIPAGWSSASPKSDDPLRLSMIQTDYSKTIGRNYKNIAQVLNSEEFVVQPLVNVWVVPTQKNYRDFLKDFISAGYESELKTKIVRSFQPNWDDIDLKLFLTVSTNELGSGSHKGMLWYGSIRYQAYINELDEYVYYGGALVAYQNEDNSVLLMTIRTEEHVIVPVLEQLQQTIYDIKW